MIKILHNPRCRKSREGLAILEAIGKPFEIVKYLENRLSEDELKSIISKLGIKPLDLVRKNEAIWKTDFKGKEADFIEDTTFRQVGIVQDVQGNRSEGVPRRTVSVYSTVKVNRTTNSDSSQYMIGEKISQGSAHGQVVGVSVNGEDIYIHYIQDPFLHCDPVTGYLHNFEGSDVITGDTSEVTSTPDTTYDEYFNDQQFLDGYSLGEIMKYRGNFTYIDNTTATKRETTQTERLSMIIEY